MNSDLSHHKRFEYCRTRLKYREGRELKAVKVYTVANESRNLLIFGVPKINLQTELKQRLRQFGDIEHVRNFSKDAQENGHELELFTEVFWIKFRNISDARKCKRYMDAKEFYGGILHISYAPEQETLDELRDKFRRRKIEVESRIKANENYTKKSKSEEK